jgi:hypothetical protein
MISISILFLKDRLADWLKKKKDQTLSSMQEMSFTSKDD